MAKKPKVVPSSSTGNPFLKMAGILDANARTAVLEQLQNEDAKAAAEFKAMSDARAWFEEDKNAEIGDLPLLIPKTPKEMKVIAGLQLLFAPAEGGKTITAMALYAWFKALGVNVRFMSAYEPDSKVTVSELTTVKHDGLLGRLVKAGVPGVVILDSLTLALRMLPDVDTVAKPLGDQTYTGGLKCADLIGAGLHNKWARDKSVALIATVNSEMLPIVRPLNGAVMGLWQIGSPGVISGAMRDTRQSNPVEIPKEHVNRACLAKGYGPYRKDM